MRNATACQRARPYNTGLVVLNLSTWLYATVAVAHCVA
jgi:hypothetical protein